MLSRTLVRSLQSNSRQLLKKGKDLKPQPLRVNARNFCEAKANKASVPPPPPPGSSGGGSGAWILILAAVGGAGYYFQDDIKKQLGMSEKKKEQISTPVKTAVEEAKNSKAPEPIKEKVIEAAKEAEKIVAKVEPPKVEPLKGPVDYEAVRAAIVELLDEPSYDDGSYGPVFVRLAWHNAGTYDKNTGNGGSEGAGMRYDPEANWGANAGLHIARARLEAVKAKHPGISYSDLWSLAGTVAIEEMGGPKMNWRPGRKDQVQGQVKLPDGLLPDADGRDKKEKPSDHLRDIFYRMGFNDKEIVCLAGAHALGRCHEDRSGFWGPWTNAPTTFSNEYYRLLLEERWSKKKTHKGREWNGPEQYESANGELMMLPTDLALVWDEKMRPYVEQYAKDEELFFKDFGKAWIKLQELGVRRFHGWRRYILFGPRE